MGLFATYFRDFAVNLIEVEHFTGSEAQIGDSIWETGFEHSKKLQSKAARKGAKPKADI